MLENRAPRTLLAREFEPFVPRLKAMYGAAIADDEEGFEAGLADGWYMRSEAALLPAAQYNVSALAIEFYMSHRSVLEERLLPELFAWDSFAVRRADKPVMTTFVRSITRGAGRERVRATDRLEWATGPMMSIIACGAFGISRLPTYFGTWEASFDAMYKRVTALYLSRRAPWLLRK